MRLFRFWTSKLVPLVCLIGWSYCALSQEVSHRNFTTADGLPSPDVFAVHQDQQGYLWFGTDRGVSRYNGYEFENFTTSDGLTHNTVFEISEDPNGDLWFQCYDGSVCIWRSQTERFVPFSQMAFLKSLHMRKWVSHIFSLEDQVCFLPSMTSDSLYRCSLQPPQEMEAVSVHALFHGSKSEGSTDVRVLQGSQQPLVYFKDPEEGWLVSRQAVPAGDSDLYFFSERTVYHYDRITQQHTPKYITPSSDIQCVRFINNKLFVGDLDGLHVFDPVTWKHEGWMFKQARITWFTTDTDGNVWVTIEKQGVVEVSNRNIHNLTPVFQQFLRDHEVVESLTTLDRYLVLGTNEEQILVLDSNNQVVLHQRLNPEKGYGESVVIITDLFTAKDTVYGSDFLLIYAEKDQIVVSRAVQSRRFAKAVQPLLNGALLWQGAGNIQAAPRHEVQKKPTKGRIPLTGHVFCAHETGDSVLWVATHDSVFQFDRYRFQQPQNFSKKHQLPTTSVRSIASNSSGLVAMGSLGQGLFLALRDSVQHIDVAAGLGGDIINTLCFESDTVLWCGGNYGLSRLVFVPSKEGITLRSLVNFTMADGLPSRFIKRMHCRGKTIWAVTDQGVFSVQTDQLNTSYTAPYIHFASAITAQNDTLLPHAELNYDQNSIQFSYLGLSQAKPAQDAFYRYRVLIDKEPGPWLATNNRTVWLSNLKPANYQLQVSAVNKNGVSSETIQFPFTVKPHFTGTLWFQVLAFALAALLIAYLVGLRFQRVRNFERNKQALRDAQMRTKQAELSMLRNQMNPHFIFNALTSVQKFILRKDVNKSIKYLSRFSKLMRNTLQYSSVNTITVAEEVAFVSNYLEIEKSRFPDLFDYQVEVKAGVDQNTTVLPALLLQPILENSVKHAFREMESGGMIHIVFDHDALQNRLVIEASDNGTGLEKAEQKANGLLRDHQSFGLNIVRERIQIMNANSGEEARFIIQSANKLSSALCGTQAKFELPWRTKT